MLRLHNQYFRIVQRHESAIGAWFMVTILPGFGVYEGHFPGNPVSPGVCSIQMIKECAEMFIGRRQTLGYIAQCRFLAPITPSEMAYLKVQLTFEPVEGGLQLWATVTDESKTYIELKGILSPCHD